MGKNLVRAFITVAIITILLLPASNVSYSISNINLSIDKVEDTSFPKVKTFVSVSDAQNYPIRGLTADNFTIIENSSNVPIQEVTTVYQKPLVIALAIDASRSMGYGDPTSMSKVKQSASNFIDTLATNDLISILSFSDDISVNQDPTSDHDLVKAALNDIQPIENASLNDAIVEGTNTIGNQLGRRILILLTDGPESGYSQYTFTEAMDNASRQNVVVYPIIWGGADRVELSKLSDLTHGKIYSIIGDQPDITAIQAALTGIAQDFMAYREQYNLGFTSTFPADGIEHEFTVRLNQLGQETEQTAHLTANPGEVQVSLPDYTEGQVVSGNVHFSPQVSSPASLAQLDIKIDNQLITSVYNDPFEYTWNSTEFQPGVHNLAFIAQDRSGNTGQLSLNLEVQPPVVIKIITPIEQETISGSTMISTTVAAQAQVVRVEYKADNTLLGTVTYPPFEYQWDLTSIPAGSHTISARAYDINGFLGDDLVNVSVAIQQKSGLFWIVGIAAVVVAAILIPLGLRTRKRIQHNVLPGETPSNQAHQAEYPSSTAILREIEGMNPEKVWNLSAETIRLGRKHDENDIPLKGLNASRKHALINFTQGHYVIQSLNPQNLVTINQEPVQQQVLNNGDVIQAGETILKFEVLGEGA